MLIKYFTAYLLHFLAKVWGQPELYSSGTVHLSKLKLQLWYTNPGVPGANGKPIWPRVEIQSEKDALHPQVSMSESTLKSIWDHSKWETRVVWRKKAGCHACDLWLYKHRTLTFTWFLAMRPKLNMIITLRVWHWFHLLKLCQN